MFGIALAQGAFKILMAVLAILAARGTLLWLDRAFSTGFMEAMDDASPDAKMLYFTGRFIAVFVLLGLVLS